MESHDAVGLLVCQLIGHNQLKVIKKAVSKKRRKEYISDNW